MSADVKEVIQEATSFFRFDLRRKGFIIEVKSSEKGWDVQAELLDPRPDLSSSYKKVYDQNIYLIRVGSDLKILSCEKIGTREKTGELRFFPREKQTHKTDSPQEPTSPKESLKERKVSFDPSFVGNLAAEISRRVSASLGQKRGSSSAEEPVIGKEVFIDPHQEANLDFNFTQVGKQEEQEEGNISEVVERLKELHSAGGGEKE